MKACLNAWTVDPGVGFAEMFAQLREAGFDGVELNVDAPGRSAHSLTMDTTARELARIRTLAEQNRLAVVSVSSSLHGDNMGAADPEKNAFSQRLVRHQLACARELGAGGILIVPGGVSDTVTLREAYENAYRTLSALCGEIAAGTVAVGVENVWNGFFMSPFDMARFIDRLDCPMLGAYYDVGNTVAFSRSEHWIDVLGSRIRLVHIKDFKRRGGIHSGGTFTDLLQGDVNWHAVMAALRRAGFDGYLTAEVSKPADRPDLSDQAYYSSVAQAVRQIISEC